MEFGDYRPSVNYYSNYHGWKVFAILGHRLGGLLTYYGCPSPQHGIRYHVRRAGIILHLNIPCLASADVSTKPSFSACVQCIIYTETLIPNTGNKSIANDMLVAADISCRFVERGMRYTFVKPVENATGLDSLFFNTCVIRPMCIDCYAGLRVNERQSYIQKRNARSHQKLSGTYL